MYCKHCGKFNQDEAVKCIDCGREMENMSAAVSNGSAGRINSWLLPAILTTACCCGPVGIVALYFAAKANAFKELDDEVRAKSAAEKARMWVVIAVAIGLLFWVFYFVMSLTTGFSQFYKELKIR